MSSQNQIVKVNKMSIEVDNYKEKVFLAIGDFQSRNKRAELRKHPVSRISGPTSLIVGLVDATGRRLGAAIRPKGEWGDKSPPSTTLRTALSAITFFTGFCAKGDF